MKLSGLIFCFTLLTFGSVFGQDEIPVSISSAIEKGDIRQILVEYENQKSELENNYKTNKIVTKHIADFFFEKKAFNQSVHFYKRTLELYKKDSVEKSIDRLFGLGNVALVYLRMGDTLSTKIYLDSTLTYALKTDTNFFKVHAYNNLGYFYSKAEQYDSALAYYNKACRFLGSNRHDSILLGSISGNIARDNAKMGYLNKAIPAYELNLRYSKILGETKDYCQTAIEYVHTLIETSNYKKANSLLAETKHLALHQFTNSKLKWLAAKALLSYKTNSDSTFYWLKQYEVNNEDFITRQEIEINRVLSDMTGTQVDLALSQQQLQYAEMDKENKKSIIRFQQYALVLLIVLSIATVVLLLYRRRVLKREKELVTEQLKTELAQQQLENETLKNEQLDLELQHKSRDVTTLAIDIHDKHQLQQEWAKKLKKLRSLRDTDQLRAAIDELLRLIVQNERINKEKAPLKEKVEEVNSAFYEKLQSQFPNLTKSERELCGMIRLNMNTKEIATLKNITAGSAKVMKHRLRKKLELETHNDLHLFISKI